MYVSVASGIRASSRPNNIGWQTRQQRLAKLLSSAELGTLKSVSRYYQGGSLRIGVRFTPVA